MRERVCVCVCVCVCVRERKCVCVGCFFQIHITGGSKGGEGLGANPYINFKILGI